MFHDFPLSIPMQRFCLLIVALSLAARVSADPHYEQAAVSQIKTGVATETELELWFGKPYERKILPGGEENLAWQYTKSGSAPGTIEKYWLFVTTGSDGKVKSFSQSWYFGSG